MNRIKAILMALLIMASVCAMAAADHPETWDWRNVSGTNYVTPVKCQCIPNFCGSCAAFAIVGAIESNILIEHQQHNITSINLSEQYFVSDCCTSMDCDGPEFWANLGTVLSQAVRVPTEYRYPYTGLEGSCERAIDWKHDEWNITGYSLVYGTESAFKDAIMDGPIVATMMMCDWYPERSQSTKMHAVLVVGWNDTEGVWICKNSYGNLWGWDCNGYGKVLYGDLEKHYRTYSVHGSYQLPPCERYDTNGTPGIQHEEAVNAINDYLIHGTIDHETAIRVLNCYLCP